MMHCMHFLNIVRNCKMKKRFPLLALEVTRVMNLQNCDFEIFCNENGFNHNFSVLRTPQQMKWLKGKIGL
ncbi:Uncharacterized protein TCM_028495 [Theobroma cacao]|uniref:Uncharacterized protein n=1 Tax=Theobroma cacao TaxID=3641 RepID=A0A061GHU5_THECC|nr:Uncharacterized protein TCM_028495 [Theobroma cacao]